MSQAFALHLTLFLAHFVLAFFAVAAIAVTVWRIVTSMRFAYKHYGSRPFIIFALLILCVVLALTFASVNAQSQTPRPPTASVVAPRIMATTTTAQFHQNTLAWNASPDATTSSYSNVYKVAGACPTNSLLSSFVKINTTTTIPPNGPYTDTLGLTAGQANSYVVTNVIGGVESSASNCITLTTPTFSPTALTGTAQ